MEVERVDVCIVFFLQEKGGCEVWSSEGRSEGGVSERGGGERERRETGERERDSDVRQERERE